MKKYTYLVLGFLAFCLGAAGCGIKEGTKETKEDITKTEETTGEAVKVTKEIDTISPAKIIVYESEEELEAEANVIVRVKKTEKEENVVEHPEKERPDIFFGYTKSMVEVEQIMKNTSGQKIDIGDEIQILENQFTEMDGDTKVTYHLERYKMMEAGHEYILYLRSSQEKEGYGILGALQGKVPVSEEEDLLFPVSQITYYENQPKVEEDPELLRVMEEVRKKSLEKYN